MSFAKMMNSILIAVICLTALVLIQPLNAGDKDGFDRGGGDLITSVPRTMSYQGILKDSGGDPVTDSIYNVMFRIFDVESGGTSFWDETLPCTTSAGLFTATFSNVNIPFDEDYWLELEVGGEILDPRQKLSMVGYAARADTADYAISIAGGAPGWTDDGSVVRLDTDSDSVGIGTADPVEKLHVEGSLFVSNRATIGPGNTNTGNQAFVAGSNNTAGANHTVVEGRLNVAGGNFATVSGGVYDSANGANATVGGGSYNSAGGGSATIAGGGSNNAAGDFATIGGGVGNIAGSQRSVVGGGAFNSAGGSGSTVAGGESNSAGNTKSTVGGGYYNSAEGQYSLVAGGYTDTASGEYSAVGGGNRNIANGYSSTIAGGNYNTADGDYSNIGGGTFNSTSFQSSTIGGGSSNSANGNFATIAGGAGNIANANGATIAGGSNNIVEGLFSAILGGVNDTIASTGHFSYLFGIGSKLTQDSTFIVDMPHIRFGDETNGYEFPASDGSVGQVMTTDGNGQLSWTSNINITATQLQELYDIIERQDAKINQLESRITELENR